MRCGLAGSCPRGIHPLARLVLQRRPTSPDDLLRLPLGVVRWAAFGPGERGAAGDEPSRGAHRGKAWCNFRPERVHWARYMGRSHRGRRTIQRRAESWVRRHAAMPRAERPAVWAGLMAVEAGE